MVSPRPQIPLEQIEGWCRRALGAGLDGVLFEAGYLPLVLGVALTDGREVVIKIRPRQDRLHGCQRVQRLLFDRGLPCAQRLSGPDRVDGNAMSVESMLGGGEQLPPANGAEPFAALLAELVERAPRAGEVPPLDPAPPWAAWDHVDPGLWPAADDYGRDLDRFPGPAWLDSAAAAVRNQLADYAAEPRVGHADWESQTLRWAPDGSPLAVHDWDSVVAQPEAAIAGMASAVWTRRGGAGESPTVEESDDFLRAYVAARGIPWSGPEERAAWAAGLWVRLVEAKMAAADGAAPQLDRTEQDVADRLRRAGVTR